MRTNYFFILAIILTLFVSCGKSKLTNGTITIAGENHLTGRKLLQLYNIRNGSTQRLESVSDTVFSVKLDASQAGFLNIATSTRFTFIAEPGDSIYVVLNNDGIVFSGDNQEINNTIEKRKQKIVNFYKQLSDSTAQNLAGSFNELIETYSTIEQSGSPFVNMLIKSGNKYDLAYLSVYLQLKSDNQELKQLSSDEVKVLFNADFPDTIAFSHPLGMQVASAYLNLKNENKDEEITPETFFRVFGDGDFTSYLTYTNLLKMDFVDSAFIPSCEKYMDKLLPVHKPAIAALIENAKSLTPGKLAPMFGGKTLDGKVVTLADLKGKPVYVDVWATWCGPCKREIPFLDELIKTYKDKVTFLKISVDEDYAKWEAYMNEHGGGDAISIIAEGAWKSDVVKKYSIKGIPRFMLFDAEGNVITINADRPSSQGIRATLDAL